MIYQLQDKMYRAEFLGLPVNTFFKMPYKDYMEMSYDFLAFQEKAENWYDTFIKDQDGITMGEIWAKYYSYCLSNKIETGLEKWLLWSTKVTK